MKRTILLSGLIFAVTLLASAQGQSSKDLKQLMSQMAGIYDNEKQAANDTNFFHINLVMKPIWKNRADGYWIYVEQAMFEKKEKPYRQRVYHLEQKNDSTFSSQIYALNSPLRFAGIWKEKEPLANYKPDSLLPRSGCDVILHKRGDLFIGGTIENNCPSDLRGASYATSEVSISPNMLISLDRGYGTDGKQVWGSVHGGYMFEKKSKLK